MSAIDNVPVVRLVRAARDDTAINAEQALLGALLLDCRSVLPLVSDLAVSDFADESHRAIYQGALDEVEVNGVADMVTVIERLKANGDMRAYIAELVQNTPAAGNVPRYVELIREKARRRALAALGIEIQERAERGDLDELRRDLLKRVEAIGEDMRSRAGDLIEHAFWIKNAQLTTNLPYVLKGIFGKGQIIVAWGRPGSGKTFINMEMTCCIGAGVRWHGRRTRKGIVLYVAAESARAYIENRFAALKAERPDLAEAEVLVIPLALDLLHAPKGDVERVVETVRRLERERGEVVLIVIDTLAVTFGGGNENAPEDMGAYVNNVLYIREKTGAAVLIVHHCGKDEARGMRGHSALLGALDAELAIEGEAEDRILRTGKVRDGDGNTDLFAFTLRPVELGFDSDGEPVRTCVVDAKDEAATKRARRQRKGAALGKNQKAVLRVLEERGGRMARLDLANKLKDDGMQRQRVNEAMAALLDSGMLISHNEHTPPEVSLA